MGEVGGGGFSTRAGRRAALTRPSPIKGEGLTQRIWQVLESVPDPEIPVVSVVDLGIVRAVDAGAGDDHAHLYRLPRHPGDRARHPRRARCGRLSRRRDRDDPLPALDHRLDQRGGQGEAPGLWHRPAFARRAARGRMPAMRLDAHRGDQPLRLDARARRNGAAATASSRSTCSSAIELDERRLPQARRLPRSSTRRPRRARSASHVPEELRETFQFKPGQHLTLKAEIGGEEIRRNYSLCVAPQDR